MQINCYINTESRESRPPLNSCGIDCTRASQQILGKPTILSFRLHKQFRFTFLISSVFLTADLSTTLYINVMQKQHLEYLRLSTSYLFYSTPIFFHMILDCLPFPKYVTTLSRLFHITKSQNPTYSISLVKIKTKNKINISTKINM